MQSRFVVGALGDPREPPLELVEKYQTMIAQGDALPDWIAAVRGVLRAVLAARVGDQAAMGAALAGDDVAALAPISAGRAAVMIEAVQGVEVAVARHAAVRLCLEAALLTMNDQLDRRQ